MEFDKDWINGHLHESCKHLTRATILSQILDNAQTMILTSLRERHELHHHLRKLQT